ncbi:MAG: acyl-CoA dehydrogenase family protein [Candidatus Competibacterales bacterium]
MNTYRAPVADMRHAMIDLAHWRQLSQLPGYDDASLDVVDAVLDEAGRLACDVLAPLNAPGDRHGTRVENGEVRLAPGFAEAYGQFVDGGWNGLAVDSSLGGQGLPQVLGAAVQELWQGANMAFGLCPLLTQGAIEAIGHHASPALKATYLPSLVSGHWTGAMNLTEPQAGSDLSALRAKAEPVGDHYKVTGQKIYITWGDHTAAANIVHLVLARLPDAPPGNKGISLFLVPKFLVNGDGTLGARNDVRPLAVEHKLGIHASPTCVMAFGEKGGAVGYLVGEPHKGLACMFTMMNHARLSVGIQGLGIAERAYQQALAYARSRVQGTVPDGDGRVTIIHHPDVRRMLLVMKASIEAMRGLIYTTAAQMDIAHRAPDALERRRAQGLVDLLTPVVKGWCTELAQELTSMGIQVHGGMGYIEDTGAAQHLRDARITTIYEGTTGIQALDFVKRKVLRDDAGVLGQLLGEVAALDVDLARGGEALAPIRRALAMGVGQWREASTAVLARREQPEAIGGSAVDFLLLAGTVLGGYHLARSALVAHGRLAAGEGDGGFWRAKLTTARFYATHLMARAAVYKAAVQAGADDIMGLEEARF